VKIVAFKEKHKPADKWEQEPYNVLGQPNLDISVLTVQREDGEGRKSQTISEVFYVVGSLNFLS
jgi:hypothetical protein